MTKNDSEQFDLPKFLDELIEEMGLQGEDAGKLETLKSGMTEALNNELFRAASENIEPEIIDSVMDDLRDEEDAGVIITELIKSSPGAQVAMLQALDGFRETTLEAYNQLK
jgi:hypothetical protein